MLCINERTVCLFMLYLSAFLVHHWVPKLLSQRRGNALNIISFIVVSLYASNMNFKTWCGINGMNFGNLVKTFDF